MSIFNGESFYVAQLNNRLNSLTTDQPILFSGQKGTGKLRAAQFVYDNLGNVPDKLATLTFANTGQLMDYLASTADIKGQYMFLAHDDTADLAALADRQGLMVGVESAVPVNIAGWQCVFMPPLKQRVIDIPILVNALLKDIYAASDYPRKKVDETLLQQLQRRDWPGNTGELKTVLRNWLVTGNL